MIKKNLLATAFAVAALSFTSAYATDVPAGMEVCKVGNAEFTVPAGKCPEIQKGNTAGLPPELKAEIEAAKAAH